MLLVGPDDVNHGVDQRQVGERLGIVAEVPGALRVQLLGVQPERARVTEQSFAQRASTVLLVDLA